jgi:Na+-transporting NADH:ubiquinone oxidoreductase subunit NqrE
MFDYKAKIMRFIDRCAPIMDVTSKMCIQMNVGVFMAGWSIMSNIEKGAAVALVYGLGSGLAWWAWADLMMFVIEEITDRYANSARSNVAQRMTEADVPRSE